MQVCFVLTCARTRMCVCDEAHSRENHPEMVLTMRRCYMLQPPPCSTAHSYPKVCGALNAVNMSPSSSLSLVTSPGVRGLEVVVGNPVWLNMYSVGVAAGEVEYGEVWLLLLLLSLRLLLRLLSKLGNCGEPNFDRPGARFAFPSTTAPAPTVTAASASASAAAREPTGFRGHSTALFSVTTGDTLRCLEEPGFLGRLLSSFCDRFFLAPPPPPPPPPPLPPPPSFADLSTPPASTASPSAAAAASAAAAGFLSLSQTN